MAKILITGANGLIASTLAEMLYLISEKENERSKYSEKQCQDWLEEISKQDAIPSTVKDMGDLLLDID